MYAVVGVVVDYNCSANINLKCQLSSVYVKLGMDITIYHFLIVIRFSNKVKVYKR